MLIFGEKNIAALVKNELDQNPFTGKVFVLRPKRLDRLYLLYWDGSGLVIAYTLLEDYSFSWPAITDGLNHLTHTQFETLFSGLDWRRVRPYFNYLE